MIIVDLGAGDATRNDIGYVKEVMRELPVGVVAKFQLFTDIKGLTPLDRRVVAEAMVFATEKNRCQVTASVFDEDSLAWLLGIRCKVPFIKIAARMNLWKLIDKTPDLVPVVASVAWEWWSEEMHGRFFHRPMAYMACVPKYPATVRDYEVRFGGLLNLGVSDHTVGMDLYNDYRPKLYERHFDQHGPDQEHSITLEQLRSIV